ncbi:MAG: 16S rRNA (uracil(1498)-N(3))-methyltransferase [Clostridia bacterium]|nr:16S rRNA (uracil(1498)-N(3))-methyltransferase [Clostridia bacterium]
MRRFFTEPNFIKDGIAEIFEDSKHIEKVLRMNVGDSILVFDGTGTEYLAKLVSIEKNLCRAEIIESQKSSSEPKISVSLFQGLPKSGKMETIIQKAVELGVYEIFPVIMDRSVVQIKGSAAGEEKATRWNKISLEASKQCGRSIVPKVYPPITFDEAIKKLNSLEVPLMPYEELGHQGLHGLKEILTNHSHAKTFGLLVGPEGGFSDSEAKRALDHGINTFGLGPRILRTETVASAVIPVIMYQSDEF